MTRTNPKNVVLLGLLILVLLYQFVWLPGARKVKNLNTTYVQKQKDLETLKGLIQQYQEKTAQEPVVYAPSDFNLYLFVSRVIDITGSKLKISRITPVSENVLLNMIEQHITLSIEDIELEKLLLLLNEIEKREFLRYGYLQISRNAQKPFFVKVEMELISYKARTQ
ncbi:MAG TPA: type II secretion system protein GspM [bacterium]|nr:type II secretion system protein GspM [bacterium]HPO52870.1 type II secretion system protein GspM [bacterium]